MSIDINLKERGWSLRKARPEEGDGWLWEKKDGTKTRVCEAPGEARREAIKIEEEGEAPSAATEPELSDLIIERLNACETLPVFQSIVREYGLEKVAEYEPDDRFKGADFDRVYDAVQEAADRVGLQRTGGEATDEETLAAPDTTEESDATVEPPGHPHAGETLFGEVSPLRQEIHPSRITRHPLTSMRAARDESYVLELEEVLASGRKFKDPVVLFYEKATDTYRLADGNYRTEAATRQGKMLDADVRPGTLRDAILYAAGSNVEHGRRRTNDDKRLAVVTLLLDKEWSRESDTTLADLAGHVSQPFVGKVQAWLEKVAALAAEDPDGELSDDEYVSRTGAPEGLVKIFRELPAESREELGNNVMARAETRKASDGRAFAPSRPAPTEEPNLFAEGAVEDSHASAASDDEPADSETHAAASEPRADEEASEDAEQLPPFHKLRAFLKPRPDGAHIDELTAEGAGFTMHEINDARRARAIERHENGRCFYAWKPEDIVEALRAHGGRMSRLALEELGCQSHAITAAVGDGHIRQPETGIFEPADEGRREESRPSPQSSATPSASETPNLDRLAASVRSETEQNRREPQRATVGELLKGRKGFVGFNWIQGMPGSVNVTVSVDGDMAGAVRELVEERELRLPPRLLDMIEKHIRNSKPAASKATEEARPAGASSKSSKSQPAASKKSSSKKAATKAASKKSVRATKTAAKAGSKGASKSAAKGSKGGSKSNRSTRA